MKVKVKFKCVSYKGAVVYITEVIDCPDFKVIPPKEINGFWFPETSIRSQVVDYLDSQDRSNFILKHDLGCILDYSIVEKREKRSFKDFMISLGLSEQLMLDVMAVYPKVKHLLKGKSFEARATILLSHVDLGYDAQIVAYKRVGAILKALTSEDARSLIEKK